MTPERVHEAAGLLLNARRGGAPLTELPASCRPETAADAYAIQDVVARELGGVGGWKVGAADPSAEPFCAPLPKSLMFATGHSFPAGSMRLRGVEAELAFTLAQDLPPRRAGYTTDEVVAAIRSIHAVIEVVDPRYEDMREVDALSRLADSGGNGALVAGAGRPDLVRVDQTTQSVELWINGQKDFATIGGNSAGDVLRLLVWLANHATGRAGGLRAGQMITTGSCSGMRFQAPGDRVRAVFSNVGEVELTFAP